MKLSIRATLSSIIFLFILTFCSYATLALATVSTERQPIIDSVYNYDLAGVVNMDDQDMLVTIANPIYLTDILRGTSNGAAKSGGVGALVLATNVSGGKSMHLSIQTETLQKSIDGVQAGELYQLESFHALGSLRFTDKAELAALPQGDFTYQIRQLTVADLSNADNAVIGNRPIRSVSLSIDGETITSASSNLQLNIPYTAADGENISQLLVYQINEQGELSPIINSHYTKIQDKSGADQYVMQTMIKSPGIYAVGYAPNIVKDVSGWSQPYIQFVTSRNIMDVNQQHQFLPNQLVTRADLANFLYHMAEKEGKIIENNCFSDIISGESDVDAITWACSTGIITGYEDGTFRPNQLIIRQELAAMLCRYARLFTKTELPHTVALQKFQDDNQIAAYAKNSIYDLQQAGILNGRVLSHQIMLPEQNVPK